MTAHPHSAVNDKDFNDTDLFGEFLHAPSVQGEPSNTRCIHHDRQRHLSLASITDHCLIAETPVSATLSDVTALDTSGARLYPIVILITVSLLVLLSIDVTLRWLDPRNPPQADTEPASLSLEKPVPHPAITQRLEHLDRQVITLQQPLRYLQTESLNHTHILETMRQPLTHLSHKVDHMAAKLDNIIDAIQKAADIESQRQPAIDTRSQTPIPATSLSSPAYHLHAIIPHRAWLKDANGQVIVISVGDPLPALGTVTHIDADSGTVHTASGATIQYSTARRE